MEDSAAKESTAQPGARASHDARLAEALEWLSSMPGATEARAAPISGDASFRRYFRIHGMERTTVLMDAPPKREDVRPFMDVGQRLRKAGIEAPAILAADAERGFLLLDDYGDELLRDRLDTNNADRWFDGLFALLERMAQTVDPEGLPPYSREKLIEEMELFTTWYLERHQGLRLGCEDWDLWEDLCTRLVRSAAEQPAVFVHRDFHSCNLLITPDDRIGVIDFQDAQHGPLTYDLASLLWDRYIPWPRTRLEAWMESFRTRVAPGTDPETWIRWCDWMGLQRNLKIVGIFARLHYRDGRHGYLEMIPRFWRYLRDVLPRYPEFTAFEDLLDRLECAP